MPEVPLVNEILHSGQLAYGKYGRAFEDVLREYFHTPNLLVTNTFNMAILVALETLGLEHGDTVLASPMACLSSTQPLLSVGLNVKWVDVDPRTGTLCPDSVRENIKYNPKVIIHNHYCGYIGFIDEINAIGKEFGIPVIDDGIEAFGSEYKGKLLGNTGTDVTFFSFNPVRLPNTLDGGAVIFKDKQLYEKSLLVRDAGIDRLKFRDELGEINPICDIRIKGHSATPMEVNTYIGIQQMKFVSILLEKQRMNGQKWDNYFKNSKDIISINNPDCSPNYWVYGMLAKNKRIMIEDFRKKGFYASGVHIPNNLYSVFNSPDYMPGVDDFYSKFVALPCGWWYER
ncbi:MAG: DegT/DnrJ/EryC1/StrS family aminotransferase [Salinivirgaceae bacterium]|nr:DegT/DnrJ/EryC1/StrS family aminotransferase [Salinivirgaceae bacterium]